MAVHEGSAGDGLALRGGGGGARLWTAPEEEGVEARSLASFSMEEESSSSAEDEDDEEPEEDSCRRRDVLVNARRLMAARVALLEADAAPTLDRKSVVAADFMSRCVW